MRRHNRFNCAAPFRERLGFLTPAAKPASPPLQLCRPLSGAVSQTCPSRRHTPYQCFNCAAPFRERLAGTRCCAGSSQDGFNCAAPFRERLDLMPSACSTRPLWLQLCRPLSGAVRFLYVVGRGGGGGRFNCAAPFRERLGFLRRPGQRDVRRFNCAAPFRERLGGSPGTPAERRNRFNCAAPFRERLALSPPGAKWPASSASIVPPPFGSG